MSAGWSDDQLRRVGEAAELELASRRRDGMLRPATTMWVVRVGDGLYVRSAGGPDRPWYRRATADGTGHIHAGGVEADVSFDQGAQDVHGAIDAAYHAKYDRYGPDPVSHVTAAKRARSPSGSSRRQRHSGGCPMGQAR